MLIGRICEDIDYTKYSEIPIPFRELLKHLFYNPERIITYIRDIYRCNFYRNELNSFKYWKCNICNNLIDWNLNPEDDFMVTDLEWWKAGLRSWHLCHYDCFLKAKKESIKKYPKRQLYKPKYKTNQPIFININRDNNNAN